MAHLIKTHIVRHISWIELEEMVDMISLSIGQSFPPVNIYYYDLDAIIPAYMIARKLRRNFAPGGIVFDLDDSSKQNDASFFNIVYPSDHFQYTPKVFLETLEADIEGRYQKITYPWQK